MKFTAGALQAPLREACAVLESPSQRLLYQAGKSLNRLKGASAHVSPRLKASSSSYSGPQCLRQRTRTVFPGWQRCPQLIFPQATAVEISSAPALSTASAAPSVLEAPEKAPWRAHIDFKWIRENKEVVTQNCINRNSDVDVEKVVAMYEEFTRRTQEVDKLRTDRNTVANAMKGKVEPERRTALVEEGKRLKNLLAGLEGELARITEELQHIGRRIPNMTHPDVPVGGEDVATVRKIVGEPRKFDFPVKGHLELGAALDLFDFDSAAEVCGNKFYYLKNEGALLEMALVNWALASLAARGFMPLITPDLVRSSVVEKCGFQPRGDNTQVYSIEGSDLCLAGTSEILVGGMHMDKIMSGQELPRRLVAFSHCFRTEAGAAGAATRGLYRVHQFSKVEIFAICHPDDSEALHEELISTEEELFASLGLHFKTLDMSTEDLGAPAFRKFDIEAWLPGMGRYGEISSASNCTDYQSRRLNIRFRPTPPPSSETAPAPASKGGKKARQSQSPTQFVHTLNATACAVPRMIIAILETFQQEDGSVVIPEPLQPFMGGIKVLKPKESI